MKRRPKNSAIPPLVAAHNRSYEAGTLIMELEPAIARKPRAVMYAAVVRRLPEVYAAAKLLLLKDNPTDYKELCRILQLNRDYPAEKVTVALEKALTLGAVNEATVRQLILNEDRSKQTRYFLNSNISFLKIVMVILLKQ